MEFGLERMLLQLSKLKYIFKNSVSTQNDIVGEIYNNDVRTPLFMLEGICRLYKNIYEKSFFEQHLGLYKHLEDAIGAYDYHLFIQKQTKDLSLSSTLTSTIHSNIESAKKNVLEILKSDKWLENDFFNQLIKEYKTVQWLEENDELKAIEKAYKKEIKKANEFLESLNFPLHNIEDEVHELRRKLRWLSIYTHALDGLITLDERPLSTKDAVYITPQIIASPFNKIIPHLKYEKHLHLDESIFLILSAIIDQLGTLKDEGLTIEQFQIFSKEDEHINTSSILKKLNIKANMNDILEQASAVIETFRNGNYLEKLMV